MAQNFHSEVKLVGVNTHLKLTPGAKLQLDNTNAVHLVADGNEMKLVGEDGFSFNDGSVDLLTISNTSGYATFSGTVDATTFKIDGDQGTDGQVLTSTGSGVAWEDGGGTVDGSGTANDVVMWQDSDTLTDAPIAISGNNSTFAGNVSLGNNKYISIGTDSGDAFNSSSAIRIQDTSHSYVQIKTSTTSQGGVLIGDTDDDYVGGFVYDNDGNTLTFKQNNVNALTISGSQEATFAGNITGTSAQFIDTSNPDGGSGTGEGGSVIIEGRRDGTANLLSLRSRDASAPTVALPENQGGILRFQGFDGSDFAQMGGIQVIADGQAVANGDSPSKMNFYTVPDGTETLTLALALDKSQNATFSGKILNTYTGTGFHELQNASSNGTVLRLSSTGDSRLLTLQTDHIFSNGNLFIGDNNHQTNFRGSSYDFATGNTRFHGTVGINMAAPSAYQFATSYTQTDPNADFRFAHFIDANFSGADNTTSDREQGGIYMDIDSSADGDASNEHRLYGIYIDQRFSGFSDASTGVFSRVESNNNTEKTSNIHAIHGYAVHDTNSSGGVSSLNGIKGEVSIEDNGDVDNAYGMFGRTLVNSTRAANVDNTHGGYFEVQTDSPNAISYGDMKAVTAVIDNNEGAVPTFAGQYLYYGSYQGTKGSNAYGLYLAAEDKNYLSSKLGIGNTDPNYTLDVNGNIGINDYIYHNGDDNTRIGFSGNDSFIIRTNGTDRITVNSLGRVLIGTGTANANTLTLSGTATEMDITNTSTNGRQYRLESDSAGLFVINDKTANSDRIVLNSSGNVGIGDTDPDARLHVNSSTTNLVAKFESTDTEAQVDFVDTTGTASIKTRADFRFECSGSEKLRIHSNGQVEFKKGAAQIKITDTDDNKFAEISYSSSFLSLRNNTTSSTHFVLDEDGDVGIGTTSPSEKLEITGHLKFTNNGNFIKMVRNSGSAVIDVMGFSNGTDTLEIKGGSTGGTAIKFKDTSNDIMVIHNSNVGINVTSPSYKLEVNGTAYIHGDLTVDASTIMHGNLTLSKSVGDTELLIEADTDNNNENDNPRLHLRQDGGAISAYFGLNGDVNNTFTGALANGAYIRAAGSIQFVNGGNTDLAMTIDTSQRVGIGTNSPNAILEIASGNAGGDAALDAPVFRINNTTASSDWDVGDVNGAIEYYISDTSGNAPYVASFIKSVNETGNGTLSDGALTFGTATYNASGGAVERMRIKSSGEVGISNTNPLFELCIGHTEAPNRNGLEFAIAGSDAGTNILQSFNRATSSYTPLQIASSTFQVATGSASAALHIDSSQNVGIGTTQPNAKLHLFSSAAGGQPMLQVMSHATAAGSFTSNYMVEFCHAFSGVNHGMLVKNRETDNARRTLDIADGNGIFATFTNGKLGIGTTDPDEKLHVNNGNIRLKSNSDGNSGLLRLYDAAGTEAGQIYPAGGDLKIYSAADVLFNQVGNVGIGVTAPAGKLQVVDSLILGLNGNSENYYDANDHYFRNAGLSTMFRIDNVGDAHLERYLRHNLDTNSYLGWGASDDFRIQVGGVQMLRYDEGTSGTDYTKMMDDEFRLYANGDFHADGDVVAYSTTVSSDKRLKKNIEPIINGLEIVDKLQGVHFNWKEDDKKSIGYIAQDVEKILPEMVSEKTHFDKGEFKTVNYAAMVSVMGEAIKELKAEVEQLKKQINGGS